MPVDFAYAEEKLQQIKRKECGEKVPQLRGTQVPYLAFPMLEELSFIRHGFTTRAGGASEGIFAAMNLGFSRGDREEAVRENFHRVAEELGVAENRFVFTDQTHTTNVRVAAEEDAGKGLVRPKDYRDVDGLVTNVPGLVLSVFTADCVPVFLADPVHRAIGLVHSGWRGTAGRIAEKALRLMHEQYGTQPQDVFCAIAPSICQDCYEISRDVAEVFAKAFAGREAEILTSPLQKSGEKRPADPEQAAGLIPVTEILSGGKPEDKFHLDLWQANRIVLEEAGAVPSHISVTDICTCCNPQILFSHRASQGRRGNLGAFLMIR